MFFVFLRQSSSLKVGIVRENVNKILYHPVAEVILFLRNTDRGQMSSQIKFVRKQLLFILNVYVRDNRSRFCWALMLCQSVQKILELWCLLSWLPDEAVCPLARGHRTCDLSACPLNSIYITLTTIQPYWYLLEPTHDRMSQSRHVGNSGSRRAASIPECCH